MFGGGLLLVCLLLIFIGLKPSADTPEAHQEVSVVQEEKPVQSDQTETVPATSYSTLEADEPLVIVLDPGHDSCHVGAEANGLKEEEVDWLLAEKIKEELETYRDVAIYYTIENNECPWKGLDATEELGARVDVANEHGADLLVSLHFNYSDIKSRSGF